MKKDECESAIRHLVSVWARENGIFPRSAEMPSFGQFTNWLSKNGHSHYLNFRSVRGAMADAEDWFDQELGQAWRN